MGLVLDAKSAVLYESWSRSAFKGAFDRHVEASIRTMLEPKPGESVLDIGCGEGSHLLFFRSLGLTTAGIDASPFMISKASEQLGNRSDLRVGRAEDLPYDDNQFDLAVLINTLEFLDNPLEALREAGRVARRKVFICVINSMSWMSVLGRLKGLYRKSFLNHLRFYNIWEVKSFARMAFGDAPTEWICTPMKAGPGGNTGRHGRVPWNSSHWPFGFFLGLSVSPFYTLRTAQHPLKIGGKAQAALIKGITTMTQDRLCTKRKGRVVECSRGEYLQEGDLSERGLSL